MQIKILPAGSVLTDFKSEFQSAGINQTIHRLYLEVTCKASIVTPYDSVEAEIVNQILMTEAVIVGEIPSAYYHLEGVNSNNVLDTLGIE